MLALAGVVGGCGLPKRPKKVDKSPARASAGKKKKEKPVGAPKPRIEKIEDCSKAVDEYLELRAEMNGCRKDDDCAELWPGLCPHGPYYVDRHARADRLLAREGAIAESCEIPECEPPMQLGPAHCEAGKCVTGRPALEEGCYDLPVEFVATDVTGSYPIATDAIDDPRLAIGVPSRGRMRLELSWGDCTDCSLEITQLQPINGLPVAAKTRREGERETYELPVAPATYYMRARSQSGIAQAGKHFGLRATIVDNKGDPVGAKQFGLVYLRRCPKEKVAAPQGPPADALEPAKVPDAIAEDIAKKKAAVEARENAPPEAPEAPEAKDKP